MKVGVRNSIHHEGLRIIGLGSPEFKSVEYPTMDDRSAMNLKSSDTMNPKKKARHYSENKTSTTNERGKIKNLLLFCAII